MKNECMQLYVLEYGPQRHNGYICQGYTQLEWEAAVKALLQLLPRYRLGCMSTCKMDISLLLKTCSRIVCVGFTCI